MKIVKILGGLGNQMFQYALYLSLQERFSDEIIKIDLSCFRGYPLHNGFELNEIFDLNYEEASFGDLLKLTYPYPHYRLWQLGRHILPKRKTICMEPMNHIFDSSILTIQGSCYYDGYWQNEKYFSSIRDKVCNSFSFHKMLNKRNGDLFNEIKSKESLSIHIRRGDYVNHPIFGGICDINYYKRAIQYVINCRKVDLFCIFSNDVKWCRSELERYLPIGKVIYVDWNKDANSYIDMHLMSICKHNIIANSSFSWWGAWLNQNASKIVVAPSKWRNIETMDDPVPDTWIRI